MSCHMENRLEIPAAFAQGLSCILIVLADGRSNTLSSDDFPPRSGIHFNASGERGR